MPRRNIAINTSRSTRRKSEVRGAAVMGVPGRKRAGSTSPPIPFVYGAWRRAGTRRQRWWIISNRTGEMPSCSGIGTTGRLYARGATTGRHGMRTGTRSTGTDRASKKIFFSALKNPFPETYIVEGHDNPSPAAGDSISRGPCYC